MQVFVRDATAIVAISMYASHVIEIHFICRFATTKLRQPSHELTIKNNKQYFKQSTYTIYFIRFWHFWMLDSCSHTLSAPKQQNSTSETLSWITFLLFYPRKIIVITFSQTWLIQFRHLIDSTTHFGLYVHYSHLRSPWRLFIRDNLLQ